MKRLRYSISSMVFRPPILVRWAEGRAYGAKAINSVRDRDVLLGLAYIAAGVK